MMPALARDFTVIAPDQRGIGLTEKTQDGYDAATAMETGDAEYGADGRRLIRLGDLHVAPCGGTHVWSRASLADLTISGVKVKKGRIRVSYSASHVLCETPGRTSS